MKWLFTDADTVAVKCDGPDDENGVGSPIDVNIQEMTTIGNPHDDEIQGQLGGEYSDSASPSSPVVKTEFLNTASSVSTSIYEVNSNNIVPESQEYFTASTSSNTASTSMNGKGTATRLVPS